MISSKDLYHVMTAMVPLYVAMALAYASVKWWKIFTPEQCSGINRYVALFAVPLLSFHFIATNDPYAMNFRFIVADTLQKLMILGILSLYVRFSRQGSFEQTITFFSLSTLPNTLVIGIPLLEGMYGEFCGGLMVQIVVLQCIIWYTLMLFMFEYRAAMILISDRFPETADSIISIRVESDVVSLQQEQPLETVVGDVREDGKFHVTVRLSNAEIYSVQSSMNPTPRGSSARSTSPIRKLDAGGPEADPVFLGSSTGSSVSGRVFVASPTHHHHHHHHAKEIRFVSPIRTRSPEGEEMEVEMESEKSPTDDLAEKKGKGMPPTKVMTRLLLVMVWRKLIRNPNTYSSFIGLFWSLISFRWEVEMPPIVAKSISILSDTGLGMAMFSLGLFMALQPRMIACGKTMVTFAIAVRFIIGPAFMAIASLISGIGGVLLSVAIVQAALPQGIVPFVFAKEYNLHADILSTAVIFGMLLAVPVALLYYLVLGL